MPWPERQRKAIFLNVKRKKGEKAAREFMHRHGHSSSRTEAVRREMRKKKPRHR